MSQADEPAFPYGSGFIITGIGLTKREYFAAMAMQGLVANLTIGRNEYVELIAGTSVKYADALLAELSKDEK